MSAAVDTLMRFALAKVPPATLAKWVEANQAAKDAAKALALTKDEKICIGAFKAYAASPAGAWRASLADIAGQMGTIQRRAQKAIKSLQRKGLVIEHNYKLNLGAKPELDNWGREVGNVWTLVELVPEKARCEWPDVFEKNVDKENAQ